jgi:hypothetical protein
MEVRNQFPKGRGTREQHAPGQRSKHESRRIEHESREQRERLVARRTDTIGQIAPGNPWRDDGQANTNH